MKMQKTFTLKKIVLALAIAGYTMSSAYAVLTAPTGTIQGVAPVLSAPSNSAANAVDFAHTAQTAGTLTSGDTITMTYQYDDTDGDLDDSTAHVTWYYTKGGVDTAIVAGVLNTASPTIGGTGTSVLTIPAVAVGATAIRAEIVEYSASGDPLSGTTINVADTSVGVGGGTTTPQGPIVPGNNVTPGIYLSSDALFANNLVGTATKLTVGQTYVFKLWDSAAVGTVDVTQATYNWRLVGTSATDGVNAPATGFVTSVTGANFTVPVNTAADGTQLTGSADGAQGFSLAVDY
ncbi:SinI family autotransporter-associated protein [Yersinia intermedia]|uniref:SinI family autotransporter-associated protein n=1 Tax=Yersinia intermedia TaxID=631 RepID=UPI0022FEB368|nr:SinI family autotransporter-associated protein [Yersinia intermedia]MDA5483423.1 SinI family autotransporter-associated protein [Yersinia intermedia]